jgi:DNA-binding beta-propeller fold protein YncE
MKRVIFAWIALAVLLAACKREDPDPELSGPGNSKGVFIVCEGNYTYGNSSLAFYETEKKRVYNQLYYARNKVPLGDVAQSMALCGDQLFVVVNNSGKIVVVDQYSLLHKGVINDLPSPRAIHFVNERKAYVSDMITDRMTIFDPFTLAIKGTIGVAGTKATGVGHTTESFVQVGDFVFVSCWVSGDLLLVIDSKTDQVVDSIKVPYQPNKMVVDGNGKIWVQTDGHYPGTHPDPDKPSLVRIDPHTRKVEKVFPFEIPGGWFSDIRLNPDRDSLYYLAGDLYKMAVSEESLPSVSFLPLQGKYYYSLGVDPHTGEIYLGDPADYTQNGTIFRYSSGGTPVDSFRVGICPGDYLFRN